MKKNRKKLRVLLALFAVMLCMAALPLTAYAGGGEPTEEPPTETVVPEPDPEPNPFTPDGTGTVVDTATDEDGKEFYTIVTPEENVFFLVIDHQRESDNVYFLNAVTEEDLMALAASSEGVNGESAIPGGTAEPEPPAEPEPAPEPIPEVEPEPEKGGGPGMIILAVVVILGAGAAGYYFKIYRPKQQNAGGGDEYEEYEAGAEPDVDAWDEEAAPLPGDEDAPPWDEDEATAREDYETTYGEGEEE